MKQELEGLSLHQALQLRETLNRVLEHAARGPQRERPGHSYPRRSRRPSKKWRSCKPADPQTTERLAPCLATDQHCLTQSKATAGCRALP